MKKLMLIAGGGFGVVLASALIVPSLLDVNSYKDEIFAALEKEAGVKLRCDGVIRLTLLPEAELFLSRTEASRDGQKIFKAEEARVSMQLLPLIHGKAVADSITLTRPVFYVKEDAKSGDADAAPQAVKDGLNIPPLPLDRLAVHELRVDDGTVYLERQKGGRLTFKGVNMLTALDKDDPANAFHLHVDRITSRDMRFSDVTLQGQYAISATDIEAKKWSLSVGSQTVNAELKADWSTGDLKAALELETTTLDMNELAKGLRPEKGGEEAQAADEPKGHATPDKHPDKPSSLFPKGVDLAARIKAKRVILQGGTELTEAELKGEWNERGGKVRVIQGIVAGGALSGELSAVPGPDANGPALVKGDIALKQASLENVPAAKAAGAEGKLSASLKFGCKANDASSCIASAYATGDISSDALRVKGYLVKDPAVTLALTEGKAEARVTRGSFSGAPLAGYAVSELNHGKRGLRADVEVKGMDLASIVPFQQLIAGGLAGAADVGVHATYDDLAALSGQERLTLRSGGISFTETDVPHPMDVELSRDGEAYVLNVLHFGVGGGDVTGEARAVLSADRAMVQAHLKGAGVDASKLPVAWVGGAEVTRGPMDLGLEVTSEAKGVMGLKDNMDAELAVNAQKLTYHGKEAGPLALKVRSKSLKRVEVEISEAKLAGGSVQGRVEAVRSEEGQRWKAKGSLRATGVNPAWFDQEGKGALPTGETDVIADFSLPFGGGSVPLKEFDLRADISSPQLTYKGVTFAPLDVKIGADASSGKVKAELRRAGMLGGSVTGEAALEEPLTEGGDYAVSGKFRGEELDLSRLPAEAGGAGLPRGAADFTLDFSARAKGPEDTEGLLAGLRANLALSAPEMTAADGKTKAGPVKLEAGYRDGVARLDIKRAGVAGGDVTGKASLTRATTGLSAEGAFNIKKIQLPLLPGMSDVKTEGEVSGDLTLSGAGNDMEALKSALSVNAALASPAVALEGFAFAPLKLDVSGKGRAYKAVFDGSGFAGGALQGQATASPAQGGGYAVALTAALKDFLLERLPPRFFGEKPSPLSGKASAEADLRTVGDSTQALKSGLNGSFSVKAGEGALRSEAFGRAVNGALAFLSGGANNAQSDTVIFTSAGADAAVVNGVIRSENMRVNAKAADIAGTGTINLPADMLDLAFTVKPSVSQNAAVLAGMIPVSVKGPISSPVIRADMQAGVQQLLNDPQKAIQAGAGLQQEVRQLLKGGKGDFKTLKEGLKGQAGADLLRGLTGVDLSDPAAALLGKPEGTDSALDDASKEKALPKEVTADPGEAAKEKALPKDVAPPSDLDATAKAPEGEAPKGRHFKSIKEEDLPSLEASKEAKEPKEAKEAKEPIEAKEPKEPKEAKEAKEPIEAKEPKEPKEAKEAKEPIEAKEPKEAKEAKEPIEAKEPKEAKEAKEAKEPIEAKEPKEPKEAKEAKEPKEAKDSTAPKDSDVEAVHAEDPEVKAGADETPHPKKAKHPKAKGDAAEPKTQKGEPQEGEAGAPKEGTPE